MKKHLLQMIVVLAVMALLFSACKPAATPTAEVEAKKKVAMVFPGLVTDQSWNQFGYNGLTKARDECNVEIAYSEEVFQDEQLETFRQYASAGYDIIIGHGGEYGESLFTVAKEFPDIEFVFQNGTKTDGIPNVTAVKLSYRQAGYLAGVMACEMTKTNKIGQVVGEWIVISEEAKEGFEKGAQTCGKTVELKSVATLNWADAAKAREAALALIADGVDVLYHTLDTADAGLLAAANDEGVFAIGLMTDQSKLGPNAVIGSTLISPEVMTYKSACGDYLDGGVHAIDAQSGGVDVALTALLSEAGKEHVLKVLEEMKAGGVIEP